MTLARSGDMINAMPHEKSYTLMHMTLARSFMLQTSSRDMRIADPTPVQQSFCVHLHLHLEGNETITVTFFQQMKHLVNTFLSNFTVTPPLWPQRRIKPGFVPKQQCLCSVWRSLLHWASRSSTGTQAVAPSCTPCLSLPYAPCHWPACVRLWWSPLTHIYILIRQSCFHHHRHHHHSCTVECLFTDTPQPSWPPGCTKRIVFFLNFPLLGWGPFPTRNTILQIHHHIEPWFRRKIWPWC